MNKIAVVDAMWNAIQNDDWMFIVCWGQNRKGKSSLAMQLAYEVYKDWDKVLDSIIFTVTDLFHKKKEGKPERWRGNTGFNERIPFLMWDDMAVHLNKAATQHDLTVDYFKGYFQAIATDLAVLIGTMLIPTGITLQLHEVYTHEIYVPSRGTYKFDDVHWTPNFHGWRVNPDKRWIETNRFEKVPDDVYKEYNEMRRSLTDEMEEKIMGQLASSIPFILKRLKPIDLTVLDTLKEKGRVHYGYLGEKFNDFTNIRARLKSRGLIAFIKQGTNAYYEITDLGLEVLQEAETSERSFNIPKILNLS